MAYPRNVYGNNGVGFEDTVYRYLCPVRKAGSVIGIGGEIAKQIRSETKANMRINEALPGCDERVLTIYSNSEETNRIEDDEDFVCPAFTALFKVHDMIVGEELDNDDADYDDDEYSEKHTVVTARMLVPSDQIGCLIGYSPYHIPILLALRVWLLHLRLSNKSSNNIFNSSKGQN